MTESSNSAVQSYDLIGDIHGHADELRRLLGRMGYVETSGAYRHPSRTAIFVGDFLDRGPRIPETVATVRSMCEFGSALAVIGNHEWNAFGFHLPDPRKPGQHLRLHTRKNRHQHCETTKQYEEASLSSDLSFLRSLPIRLDLPGLRVVHACWDEELFRVIDDALARHSGLSDAFIEEGSRSESALFAAIEVVLKGREIDLPPGSEFEDSDGHLRTSARVRWWLDPAKLSLGDYALPHNPALEGRAVPAAALRTARSYPRDAPPVFFGHYWLTDPTPRPQAANVACIDYSVAKKGYLCAYRWDGEQALDPSKFVTQPRTVQT